MIHRRKLGQELENLYDRRGLIFLSRFILKTWQTRQASLIPYRILLRKGKID